MGSSGFGMLGEFWNQALVGLGFWVLRVCPVSDLGLWLRAVGRSGRVHQRNA